MGCGFSSAIETALEQTEAGKLVAATIYGEDSASPYHKELPGGAQKVTVRNVYDGDTLTLVDERRVRFLGVDTPELKEKQAFAQEAKDYTKGHCHKKDIFMVVDGKDHYGRLLAWIYVQDNEGRGYLCVNEGLIQEGFAFCYIPKKDSKPDNWDKMIQLQSDARTSKRGVWKNFVDSNVVATYNGSAYHKRSCSHLAKSQNLIDMTISEASDKGLHPCRTCMG